MKAIWNGKTSKEEFNLMVLGEDVTGINSNIDVEIDMNTNNPERTMITLTDTDINHGDVMEIFSENASEKVVFSNEHGRSGGGSCCSCSPDTVVLYNEFEANISLV